jgi:hypothetical protein
LGVAAKLMLRNLTFVGTMSCMITYHTAVIVYAVPESCILVHMRFKSVDGFCLTTPSPVAGCPPCSIHKSCRIPVSVRLAALRSHSTAPHMASPEHTRTRTPASSVSSGQGGVIPELLKFQHCGHSSGSDPSLWLYAHILANNSALYFAATSFIHHPSSYFRICSVDPEDGATPYVTYNSCHYLLYVFIPDEENLCYMPYFRH